MESLQQNIVEYFFEKEKKIETFLENINLAL
jgi:hypothetical protein